MAHNRFEKFAWGFLFYLIAVILFGAWVRITHSGAGCGSHWPTCQGEIVPIAPSINTIIEFTHRLTSGLCGVFGLMMVFWAWRLERSGPMFLASAATLFFVLVEGAIGAGLVLKELVADDDSVARAIVVALHLSNTLLLTASATLAAWLAGGHILPRPPSNDPFTRRFALAVALLILTSMTGAVTALGDTLFPIEPTWGPGLIDKVGAGLSTANHFLVRLRAVHPAVAIFAGLYVCWLVVPLVREGGNRWAKAALHLTLTELALGALNVLLAAPGWLQIIHLLLAHSLWVTLLLTALSRDREGAVARDHDNLPLTRATQTP